MKKDKIRNYIALLISLTLHLLLLSFNSKLRMRAYEKSESKYKVGLVSINSIKTKMNEDLENELNSENMENLKKTISTNNKEGLEGEEKTPSFHIPFENHKENKENKEYFNELMIENHVEDNKKFETEKNIESLIREEKYSLSNEASFINKEDLSLEKKISLEKIEKKDLIDEKSIEKEVVLQELVKTVKENSNKNLEEKQNVKEKLENKDENILSISNGEIRVRDNDELVYKIIRMPEANYPSRAKRQKIDESIKVEASFVIGTNGRVKNIELSSNFREFTSLGFAKEVENNLKKYKFSPIYYRGQKVEVLFYKVFIFEMN